jgi:hypothetical protein
MELKQAQDPVLAALNRVAVRNKRAASGESTSTLSPQLVRPSKIALPVATTRLPLSGSTAAPLRDQIAESLVLHELGTMIERRSLQSEFQTCAMRPVRSDIVTTWP